MDLRAPENVLVVPEDPAEEPDHTTLEASVVAEVAARGVSLDAPDVEVTPEHNLMVIYTSGTTGLPGASTTIT